MDKKFLKEIIDKLPIGYSFNKIICDKDGQPYDFEYLAINKVGQKNISATEDLIGKKVSDIFPKQSKSLKELIKICGDVALNGTEREFNFSDWYTTKKTKIRMWSPEKNYFVMYFADITKDQEKDNDFQVLLMALNDIIFELNNDFVFENVFTNNEQLLFIPKDQIIGRSINEIFDEKATEYFVSSMRESKQTGESKIIIYPSINEQEQKWFSANIMFMEKIQKFIISISDISKQKNDCDQLQLNKKEFEKTKALQDTLFEIFSNFINTKEQDIKKEVEESLAKIVKVLDIDKAFIYHYDLDKNVSSPRFVWTNPMTSDLSKDLKEVPMSYMNDWNKAHMKGKSIYIESVSDLSDQFIKEEMEYRAIKSFLSIPLNGDGKIYGFIGLESILKQKSFSEEEQATLNRYGQLLLNLFKKYNM